LHGSPVRNHHQPPLLLNAHFDTVSVSPGGSDDGANVAVLLDVLEVLASAREPLHHNLMLLFNGAEELGMLGSKAFAGSGGWANSYRAFINLDACGSGGRELLFRASPHSGPLLRAYLAAAPHPSLNVIGEEFDAWGLLGSMFTDYSVFKQHAPGIDMAQVRNGWVYHTHNDS